MERCPVFMIGRLNIAKMSIIPKQSTDPMQSLQKFQ